MSELRADPAADQLVARQVWLAQLRGGADSPAASLTPGQWSFLAGEAARHKLGALTYRVLADGPLAASIPVAVEARLRAEYLDTAMRNAVLLRRTSELVAALTKAGMPVMLLKGVHLCRYIYPEPALRSMADVDLMVPRDRLAEAERILLDLGFGPVPRPDLEQFCTWSNHLAKLYKSGAPVIELHWAIERPTSPFRIELDGLWERSRPATLEGVPVRLLAPEDLLLHLALHGSFHHSFSWSALKGLVDVDAVVAKHGAELNWQVLVERARTWGATGFVYTTLRLAGELLATPMPPGLLSSLSHHPGDEAVVKVAKRYILMPQVELPEAFLELARKKGLRDRWDLVASRTFPPPQAMERIYGLRRGTVLVYPYYAWRLVDLLSRRSRLLLRTLLRSKTVYPALERNNDRRGIDNWVKHRSERRPTAGTE